MKIISKEDLLSNNKKRIIKRYYNQLKKSGIKLESVEVTYDGILYQVSYNNKSVVIEDDILDELTFISFDDPILKSYINAKYYCNNRKFSNMVEDIVFCDKYAYKMFTNRIVDFVRLTRINEEYIYELLTYEEIINNINVVRKCNRSVLKRIKTYSKIDNPITINDSKGFYIYKFLNKYNEILYIGKTIDINDRMQTHFGSNGHLGKYKYSQVHKIEYIECDNNADMSVKEIYFINKYKPPFNTSTLWDGEISNEIYDNIIWNKEFDMKLIKEDK